jgi:hypothetical protein
MDPIQNQQGAKTLSARTDFVQIVQSVARRDRAPTTADRRYQVGTAWIDKVGGRAYQLVRVDDQGAHWVEAGGIAGPLNDLAGDSGDALPASGSITIAGGDNITTSATGSTLTVSLDAAITVDSATLEDGSLEVQDGDVDLTQGDVNLTDGDVNLTDGDVNLTDGDVNLTNGNVTLSDGSINVEGDLNITKDGGKILAVAATAAAAGDSSFGSVELVAGTATIATTAVTANSLIFLTVQALGTVATAEPVHAHTITPGTSFVITSADITDTSTVAWFIVN